MMILNGIEMKNKALWLARSRTLVIADLHLGYEEALAEIGILVPRTMFQEMKKEITDLMKLKPKTVVINGDLKHEFGEISRQEWKEINELLDFLLKKCRVVLIKGNHDAILEPIAKKKNIEMKDFICIDDVCILHGHKMLIDEEIHDKKIKTIIIGHDHPAVSLHEGVKKENYKCFLLGKWRGKNLIIMPSFFTISEGTDVKEGKFLNPYIDEKTKWDFEVFVIGDKVYKFGKLKDI